MRPECATARDALIDEALGQAEPSEETAARAHVESCAECQSEVAALRATVLRLRHQPDPGLLVTPEARARLSAELDAIDAIEHEERPAPLQLEPALASPARGWLKVAAALLVTTAAALLLKGLLTDEGARDVAGPPGRETPADGSAPDLPTIPRRDLVQQTPDSSGTGDPIRRESVDTTPPLRSDPRRPDPKNVVEKQTPPKPEPAPETPGRRDRESKPVAADPALENVPLRTPEDRHGAPTAPTPVGRALEWLARNQRPDGSWKPGSGEPGIDTGVTGLALLALIADGHAGRAVAGHAATELDHAADRAIAWLQAQQDPRDGRFRGGRDEAAQLYCHSIASLALLEAHVHGRAAGGLDAASAARDAERLERAFTRLEIDLDVLLDTDALQSRCAGQNAAWAALALTTARHSGVELHLKPSSDGQVARVLERLRSDQPELMIATKRAIFAMADRTNRAVPPSDQAWAVAVDEVITHPDQVEPSLRFLVASALCSAQQSGAAAGGRDPRREWRLFELKLSTRLLAIQSPVSGYFDSGVRWECFGGGVAGDTALAVLALTVGAQHDAWDSAREKLRAK